MMIKETDMQFENLVAVIHQNMAEAQTTFSDDKKMKQMFIEDAVDVFAVLDDLKKGLIESAAKRVQKMDTVVMEDVLVALKDDMGREWTETNFGVEFA